MIHPRSRGKTPNATFEIFPTFFQILCLKFSHTNIALGSTPFELSQLARDNIYVSARLIFEARIEASYSRYYFPEMGENKHQFGETTLLSFRPRVISCHFVSPPSLPPCPLSPGKRPLSNVVLIADSCAIASFPGATPSLERSGPPSFPSPLFIGRTVSFFLFTPREKRFFSSFLFFLFFLPFVN